MVFSLIHSSILALIQSTANERVSRSQCSQRKVFPLHNSTTSLLEYVFPTNFFHQQHPSFSIFHWSARRGCGVLDNCHNCVVGSHRQGCCCRMSVEEKTKKYALFHTMIDQKFSQETLPSSIRRDGNENILFFRSLSFLLRHPSTPTVPGKPKAIQTSETSFVTFSFNNTWMK